MINPKQIALVTGSSKGIGKAIAKLLSQENYYIYITYNTDKKGAQQTLQDIGNANGSILQLDVRDQESVKNAISEIQQNSKKLDILVNNAGIEISGSIEKTTFKNWETVTETKINGVFLMTKYSLELLKKSENPNIINITSSLGQSALVDSAAYCTANAGLDMLTKLLALEFAKYKIRTNAISPGATLTPLWDNMGGNDPVMWKSMAKSNPLGRTSTPEDIAQAVLMLVNDKTKYLNGNTIYVNGGGHL